MRRALVLVATLVVTTCALVGPVWGAGDPALDRLIVKNPIPGWSPLSSALLQTLVATQSRTESAAANEKATVAAEGWQGTSAAQRLIVVLNRFAHNVPAVARNVRTAAESACLSATGNAPTSVTSELQVPGSDEAGCSGRNSLGQSITGTTIAWVRGNVFVLLLGVGVPTASVEAIAQDQDAAVPPGGVSESSSDTGTVVVILAAVVVLGLVIGLVVAAHRRRRRTAMSPPRWSAPEGGASWVADPSGLYQLRYWSGTAWTEHVMSNGVPGTDHLPGAAAPVEAPESVPAAVAGAADGLRPDPAAPVAAVLDAGAAPPAMDGTVVSDDGHWFWNGASWVSTTSSDGRKRWNGSQWVELPGQGQPFT